MEKEMKVLVAHPAQQHSYRLATALKRVDMLGAYATTVYNAKGSLTRLATKVLPSPWREKAANRACEALDDADVKQFCETGGLAVLFCHNLSFARRWYWDVKRGVEDRFARKVARFAVEEGFDAVVSYDGTSPLLFETLEREAPQIVRILDMSAANDLYLRSVFERDLEVKPAYAQKLKNGWQSIWNPTDNDRARRELGAAQYFLCGSSFVRRSLGFSGVSSERCAVCHYGVDLEQFAFVPRCEKDPGEPLEFIYVGQVSEHKGFGYLVDAFESVKSGRAHLTVLGSGAFSAEEVAARTGNIELVGSVLHEDVASYLAKSDVMLFPSLGDGFPLSIMEALSCGVPVVCSSNTGAADVIEDGRNGFVIPAQDQEALDRAIAWFCEHRDRIPAMSVEARKSAEACSWDDYYQNVAGAVASFIEKNVI